MSPRTSPQKQQKRGDIGHTLPQKVTRVVFFNSILQVDPHWLVTFSRTKFFKSRACLHSKKPEKYSQDQCQKKIELLRPLDVFFSRLFEIFLHFFFRLKRTYFGEKTNIYSNSKFSLAKDFSIVWSWPEPFAEDNEITLSFFGPV